MPGARGRSARQTRAKRYRESSASDEGSPPPRTRRRTVKSPARRNSGPSYRTRPKAPSIVDDDEGEDSEASYVASDQDVVEEDRSSGDETPDEAHYEALREQNMRMNEQIMAELGLTQFNDMSSLFAPSQPKPKPAPKPRAPKKKEHPVIRDRSGYIISLPPPGETQAIACIEIRADRRVRKAIEDGEYEDATWWAPGEDRRWRFGRGRGRLGTDEEGVVDGVGPDFRWRRFGAPRPSDNTRARRREAEEEEEEEAVFTPEQTSSVPQSKIPYSALSGPTCHQCKRKSNKPKMICRNVDRECENAFCSSCCRRYTYFEFDDESRSFICPVCNGVCNCSQCLRKRKLGHLIENDKGFTSLRTKAQQAGMTLEQYIKHTEKRAPEFDRVRLVNRADDIESPPLSQEWLDYLSPPSPRTTKKRKRAGGDNAPSTGRKGGKGKGKGKGKVVKRRSAVDGEVSESGASASGARPTPVILRFKNPNASIPSPPMTRGKEVDSDGDTVHGYSSDEGSMGSASRAKRARSTHGRTTRSPSSSSSTAAIDPPSINEYLARAAPSIHPSSEAGDPTQSPFATSLHNSPAISFQQSPYGPTLDLPLETGISAARPSPKSLPTIQTTSTSVNVNVTLAAESYSAMDDMSGMFSTTVAPPSQTSPRQPPSPLTGLAPSFGLSLAQQFGAPQPMSAMFRMYSPNFDRRPALHGHHQPTPVESTGNAGLDIFSSSAHAQSPPPAYSVTGEFSTHSQHSHPTLPPAHHDQPQHFASNEHQTYPHRQPQEYNQHTQPQPHGDTPPQPCTTMPQNGEQETPSRIRRPPPPAAHIVRHPKHYAAHQRQLSGGSLHQHV